MSSKFKVLEEIHTDESTYIKVEEISEPKEDRQRRAVTIVDLDTGDWELNSLELPLYYNYKNPYLSFTKIYTTITEQDAIIAEGEESLDKLIAGLIRYKEAIYGKTSKNPKK